MIPLQLLKLEEAVAILEGEGGTNIFTKCQDLISFTSYRAPQFCSDESYYFRVDHIYIAMNSPYADKFVDASWFKKYKVVLRHNGSPIRFVYRALVTRKVPLIAPDSQTHYTRSLLARPCRFLCKFEAPNCAQPPV